MALTADQRASLRAIQDLTVDQPSTDSDAVQAHTGLSWEDTVHAVEFLVDRGYVNGAPMGDGSRRTLKPS